MPRILEVRFVGPFHCRGPKWAGIRAAARAAIRARVASGKTCGRCTFHYFTRLLGHFVKSTFRWQLTGDTIRLLCRPYHRWRSYVALWVDPRENEMGEPNGFHYYGS